jgi:hypothetical protein
MRLKNEAIKAQQQLLYNELIKYVELIASVRDIEQFEDFIDFAKRRPAFLIVTSSLSLNKKVLISSHNLSPATLRQDHLNSIEMPVIAQYGRTSITIALMISRMRKMAGEVIEIAEEIGQMRGGIGNA